MAKRSRPLVIMLGLRGLPNVQGGVEKHVEALAPLLVKRGWDVEVLGRSPYLPPKPQRWKGVTITPLWAPRRKSLEAILHTGLGVFAAWKRRPDLVHIHAVGPALLAPVARLVGLRVVVTHHGYDYDRSKWNRLAKTVLKLGERFGMGWSHLRIAVSGSIAETMRERYGRPVHFLPNGVTIGEIQPDVGVLDRFALLPRAYVLTVSRLVPEKRQLDLIAAYGRLRHPGYKLVIVGGADHPDAYEAAVRKAAAATPGVVMTGFQSGAALAGLFANAGLFVLPSSHEGMPIALLEALAHGLPVLASDIVPNLEVGLPEDAYFPLGDTAAMAMAIQTRMARPDSLSERQRRIGEAELLYGWERIADGTAALYHSVLPADRRPGSARGAVMPAE